MNQDNIKNNDKRIDDIISMLDKFTLNDGGHMNIVVEKNSTTDDKNMDIHNTQACAKGTACQIPTFFDDSE